jgi:2-oxoglutarate dehydrogenase E2 component (dihydrolipoamide succinyltransferase)
MGESIVEGTLTKWLKKPGDKVERDEPLFEISTDKVDTEIPSPAAGVLGELLVQEGQTVQVNAIVARIDEGGSAAAAAPAPPAAKAPEPVPGTGAGGRITKDDVEGHMKGAAPAAPVAAAPKPAAPPVLTGQAQPTAKIRVEAMTTMRVKIAEHMVMSKRVSAHVTTVHRVDMTKVAKARAKAKDEFQARNGMSLTFLPFIVRAACDALRAFPTINASIDGTNIVFHNEINIGIAVALDGGLIVPVIRNADEKNVTGLQKSIVDLASRARAKQLKPDEIQGGTFSITNFGSFGSVFATPVINQPQVAILGCGTVEKVPVVVDDAIAIRSQCFLALTFDHRLIDGALADQYTGKVKQILENWSEEIL